MNTLRKLEETWSRDDQIRDLKRRANDMIEERLPAMWKDGDIRYLSPSIYDLIERLMDQAFALEHGTTESWKPKRKLVFRGAFGEIEIRRVV